MRCFIAIDIPEEIKEKINKISDELKKVGADIRFVNSCNLHVTVKFLGEVNEAQMKEITTFIKSSLSSMKPIKISINGLGYFGKYEQIRTIFADIIDGKKELHELIETINKRLFHIRKEKHATNVHITIGRVKSEKNKEKLLKKLREMKDVKIGDMHVKQLILKKSELTKDGPVYSDIETYKLL